MTCVCLEWALQIELIKKKKKIWKSFAKKRHKINAVFLFIKSILLKVNAYSEMKMTIGIFS